MKFKINQAVFINDGRGGGKDFPRGVHEVPEHLQKSADFAKFVEAGWIVEVDQKKVGAVIHPTPADVAKRVLGRVGIPVEESPRSKAAKAPEVEAEVPLEDPAEEPLSPEEQAKADDEKELARMEAEEKAAAKKPHGTKKHGKG